MLLQMAGMEDQYLGTMEGLLSFYPGQQKKNIYELLNCFCQPLMVVDSVSESAHVCCFVFVWMPYFEMQEMIVYQSDPKSCFLSPGCYLEVFGGEFFLVLLCKFPPKTPSAKCHVVTFRFY